MKYMFVCGCVLLIVAVIVINQKVSERSGARIFSKDTVNVGEILRDTTVSCEFFLGNNIPFDMREIDVSCSCGCMRVQGAGPANSQNSVRITYSTYRQLGFFRKSCKAFANNEAVAELTIEGTVVPEIEVLPRILKFTRSGPEEPNYSVSIRRIGLTAEQFRSLKFRSASSVMTVSEGLRSESDIVLFCRVSTSVPNEIAKGIYCEFVDDEGKTQTVSHIECTWDGPMLVPSAGVYTSASSGTDELHRFILIAKQWEKIRRVEVVARAGSEFIGASFDNEADSNPVVLVKIRRQSPLPISKQSVRVYFDSDDQTTDSKFLELPLTFI